MIKNLSESKAVIFTDGSCHTQKKVGAWVALLFHADGKIILHGSDTVTTHNRMELMAVIKGIEYVSNNMNEQTVIEIVTDSQYVMGLPARAGKLAAANFITKKGTALQNTDLLKILFNFYKSRNIHFTKIKAHQKNTGINNYNIEADKLSRQTMRQLLLKTESSQLNTTTNTKINHH